LERPQGQSIISGKKIGIVCHELCCAGGLLRFERFGRVAAEWGNEINFVIFSDNLESSFDSQFKPISVNEAIQQQWDITMIPGAGFPLKTIEEMAVLKKPNFGIKVQHILNDQTKSENFLLVNSTIDPDIVVFNNRHWSIGSFTKFQAKRFHFLEGAVDSSYFSPIRYKKFPEKKDKKIIGGLANKNPFPLIEAAKRLSKEYVLKLFGNSGGLCEVASDLISERRLQLLGLLREEELPDYYNTLDCVVHTEKFAGWSNLSAEALSCGVPLVCTAHGTLPFAENHQTAIVVEPTPEEIQAAIEKIFSNKDFSDRLSLQGRKRISFFSWYRYAHELLEIAFLDDKSHYLWAPELGLYGKWPIESRLRGLNRILESCSGKSVVDFGSGEGVIALEFLKNGAESVHGFELDKNKIDMANRICSAFPNAVFKQADLSDFQSLKMDHAGLLKQFYDIVLYLGLQHHFPPHARIKSLVEATKMAKEIFVIRTTRATYEMDMIKELLAMRNFNIEYEGPSEENQPLGDIKIFRRRQ